MSAPAATARDEGAAARFQAALTAGAGALVGGALLLALPRGTKWALVAVAAVVTGCALVLARDRRLLAAIGLAAALPLGLQYGFWSHGARYATWDHFGGAPAEPILYLVDLPIAIVLFLWGADLALGRRRLPAWTRLDTAVAIFLLLCLASIAVTSEPGLLLAEMLRYAKYLLLFWALRTTIDRPEYLQGFALATFAVLAIEGLVALAQYFLYLTLPVAVGGVTESAFELMGGEVIQRVTGLLGHSNTFAAWLLVPLGLGMLLLVARIPVLAKAALLPPLALGGLALILTFSRTGLLCGGILGVLIGALALATGRLHRVVPIALVIVALVVVLLIFGFGIDGTTLRAWGVGGDAADSGLFGTVWTRLVFDPGKAVESREDLLRIAGEMVRRHPLTGIGLNSFEENMALYDRQGTVNIIHQPVHNVFALVAAETGLPSLAAFVAIGAILGALSWRLLWRGDEIGFVAGGTGLVVVVGLGCANFFDLTLRKEPLLGTVTLVAAVVMALERRTQTPSR